MRADARHPQSRDRPDADVPRRRLLLGVLGAFAYDGTYFVCSAFDPARAVDSIERDGITLLYGSPTHLHGILSAPNFSPGRMKSVQTVVYAGAAMPGPVLDRLNTAFAGRKIVNIYGTTEIMNGLYMPEPAGRPHVYRPGFYSDVRVGRIGGGVNDIAGIGEEGELLVDSTADATFLGYLNRPEATAEKMQGGWYRTGDIAVRREDGDLEVRGPRGRHDHHRCRERAPARSRGDARAPSWRCRGGGARRAGRALG
ncbi:MAG: AMP-binding protein [Gammaproteobacteria bacterium]